MKQHESIFDQIILVIVAIIGLSSAAVAAVPAAPVNLAARVLGTGGFSSVLLTWNSGDATATHYDLYMHAVSVPGTTFARIAQVGDSSGSGTFSAVTAELSNGTYDFNVKAVNADGESPAGSTVRVVISGAAIRFDRSVYYFDSTLVGVHLMRDFNAESSDGGAILYSLQNAPSGMTINAQSGLLDWTPTEPGVHSVNVIATLASDPTVSATMSYTIIVNYNQSDLCARISGTVRDENGANVDGRAQVSVFLSGGGATTLETSIVNGAFTLAVPRGTMIVQVMGDVFRPEYYNDASTGAAAGRITLSCNQTRQLAISVTRVDYGQPDSITGRVVDAITGRGIPSAHVQFFVWPGHKLVAEFEANASGQYLAVIPRDTTYSARAYDPANQYEPEYYGGVPNPSAAYVIDPRTASSGIDFFLTPAPSHRNALQGTLVDTAGHKLSGRIVASRIDSTGALGESFETPARLGDYFFFDLAPGEYAVWGDASDSMHVPGYHRAGTTAALAWTDATRITVANGDSLFAVRVTVVYRDGFGGKARISGDIVSSGGTIRKSDRSGPLGTMPVEGAMVYAINASNRVAAYTVSNANGHFEITGLSDGLYTLLVDKIGLQPLRQSATASETGSTVELVMESRSSATPLEVATSSHLAVVPNPIGSRAAIRFSAGSGAGLGTTALTLSDLTGTTVIARQIETHAGENSIVLETAGIPNGTYILRIGSGATAHTRLVIISH